MTDPLNLTNERAKIYQDVFCREDRGPIAFVAVSSNDLLDGIEAGLGIAVANESGYTPIPLGWARYATHDDAANHADVLNASIGVDQVDAFDIIASTMGGKRFVRVDELDAAQRHQAEQDRITEECEAKSAARKITFRCHHCAGSKLKIDASAVWDDDAQAWVFSDTYDYVHCEDCDTEAKAVERDLETGAPIGEWDLFDSEKWLVTNHGDYHQAHFNTREQAEAWIENQGIPGKYRIIEPSGEHNA